MAWADVSVYFYHLFLSKGYFTLYRRTKTPAVTSPLWDKGWVSSLLLSADGLMPAGCEGLCTLKQDGKILKGQGGLGWLCNEAAARVSLSFPCLNQLALGLLCRAEDHLHFRECKNLSLSPGGEEVIPALSPGTTGRRPGDTQL